MSYHRDRAIDDLRPIVFSYMLTTSRTTEIMSADVLTNVADGLRRLTFGTEHVTLMDARASFLRAAASLVCMAADLDRLDDETHSQPEPKE